MKYKHALFLNPYLGSASSSAIDMFLPMGLEYVATSARTLAGKRNYAIGSKTTTQKGEISWK